MSEIETVGLREFSNAVSTYVRRAAIGVRVLLTDRGRVIAELVKPGASAEGNAEVLSMHPKARELSSQGDLKLAATTSLKFNRGAPLAESVTACELINELRGE